MRLINVCALYPCADSRVLLGTQKLLNTWSMHKQFTYIIDIKILPRANLSRNNKAVYIFDFFDLKIEYNFYNIRISNKLFGEYSTLKY